MRRPHSPGGRRRRLGRHEPGPALPHHRRAGGELQPYRAHRQHGAECPRAAPESPLLVGHRTARAPRPRPHGSGRRRVDRATVRSSRVDALRQYRWRLRARTLPGPCLRPMRRPDPGRHLRRRGEPSHRLFVLRRHALLCGRGVPPPSSLRRAGATSRQRVAEASGAPPCHSPGGGGGPGGDHPGSRRGAPQPAAARRPGLHLGARRPPRKRWVHRQTDRGARRGETQSVRQEGGHDGQDGHAARPGQGPGLHRHRELVQHAGRQTAVLGPAEGQGGAGRLLDLLVHQLPAFPPPRGRRGTRTTRTTASSWWG